MNLLDRRLLFVTGKGGVGKTTVAAAIARLAARDLGKRVLLCEMDGKGALADAFAVAPLAFEPRELTPGLHAMAMNTEDSLTEYLRLFVKIPLLGRIGPLARTFDFVADAAPGVKEILAIGKLCYEVRERHFDLVVVDAEATGHILGQINAPRTINQLVQVGLVRDQTRWMLDLLEDASVTGLVVTTTPEEMPVTESIELIERVRAESAVDVGAVIVNRTLPEPFGAGELAVFNKVAESVGEVAGALGSASPARRSKNAAAADLRAGVQMVVDAAALSTALRRTSAGHLDELRSRVAASIPLLYVPEFFSRAAGARTVELVATALAEELL